MNNIAAGVVNNSPVVKKPSTPQAESSNRVRKQQPKRDKSHPSLDVHPSKNRPAEQNHRDRRKRELEVDERRHRVKRLGLDREAVFMAEALGDFGLVSKELLAERRRALGPEGEQLVAEGHAVADEDPADQHGGEGVESHEGRVHRPLLLHYAGV